MRGYTDEWDIMKIMAWLFVFMMIFLFFMPTFNSLMDIREDIPEISENISKELKQCQEQLNRYSGYECEQTCPDTRTSWLITFVFGGLASALIILSLYPSYYKRKQNKGVK